MPIGWFICPYKRRVGASRPTRYCEMDDFTSTILGDGGTWSETEVLGDHAIVKVRASSGTLTTLAAHIPFLYIALTSLDERVSSLSAPEQAAIVTKMGDLGYPTNEIERTFPSSDISSSTLQGILDFIGRRRLKPRYDSGGDTIILDGPVVTPKRVDRVDTEVRQ